MNEAARQGRAWRLLPLALIAAALALGYALDLHHYLSIQGIRSYQASLSAYVESAPLRTAAVYVLVYVVSVALSFPGASVLTVAGGFMFGAFVGTGLAGAAATMGAVLIFLIARSSIGGGPSGHGGSRVQELRRAFARDGFSYVLFLRLVPLFPFWLVNLAAAASGIKVFPYAAATGLGIVPGTFAYALFGAGLGTSLDEGKPQLSSEVFIGMALIGLAALAPVLIRRLRAQKPSADE